MMNILIGTAYASHVMQEEEHFSRYCSFLITPACIAMFDRSHQLEQLLTLLR